MARPYQIHLWKRAPFTRLLPPLICGIIIEYFFNFSFTFLVISLAATVACMLLYEGLHLRYRFILRPAGGILYMFFICFSGAILSKSNNLKEQQDWYGNHLQDAVALKIIIRSKPQDRGTNTKAVAEVISVITKDSVIKSKGKVVFYLSADSSSGKLSAGDVLLVKSNLQNIRNSGNPGSFDYRAYMANKQIFHQAFLKASEWEAMGVNQQNFFEKAIGKSLDYSQNNLNRNIHGPQEIALAKALLTGDRTELDPDLVQAYANTGVVHIMAISGLHLGLIYLFLIRFAGVLPVIRKNQFARMILVLSGIWFFALMTGGSPSVMRAAVMFSFLSLGIVLKKKVASYNFWSASAFVLLCFNPLLLLNVGFQLSYLAVLGILVVQKPIYNWLYFENKLVDYTWQIISVTLSAQLFTLPLTLFYFHQFPLLFVVTNLIAIPLASLGLWLGILLLLTSWISFVPTVFGFLAEYVFGLLNSFIHYMDDFSFSVWSGFFLNVQETIVISLAIISLMYWLMLKKKIALKFTLFFVFVMGIFMAIDFRERSVQQKIVVYNIPYCTAIDFISGYHFSHVGNIPEERMPAAKTVLNVGRQFFKITEGGRPLTMVRLGENDLYLSANQLLHIKKTSKFLPMEKTIKVDAIILSNSPKVSIAELNKTFEANLYIFPPSNKPYQIEKWKKECEELHLRSHDIMSEGALVLNY